jgi:glycosyltransferase involved in cell wall biosynthesis
MEPTVIINATSIGHSLGGIGVYGVNLIKALARAGGSFRYTVLVSRDAWPHFADTAFPSHMTVRRVGKAVSPDRGSTGHLFRWLYANRLALGGGSALVFGASQIEAPLVGPGGIVMVHDLIPLMFPAHHPRQRYFYRYLLGPALRAAAAVIAPSLTTKDLVERHYRLSGEKIRVIPHGVPVPTRRQPEAARTEPPLILCVGRAGPMKNTEALLAAHRLLAPGIGARLVFVGVEAPRGGALGAAVTFHGAVSETEKLELLDRASLLVSPSLYEGFGFPALEAMARGCPVIASTAGSLPEVCGDAARYVDPLDPARMAAALQEVLLDERLRADLIERGFRRARTFSWENSAREHVNLFEEVLAQRAHGLLPAPGR